MKLYAINLYLHYIKCNRIFESSEGNVFLFSSKVFNHTNLSGYFAAASFMSFQQCEFNFGSRPFLYYPRDEKNNLIKFQSFNDHAVLSEDEKVILPRHKKLEILKMISIKEDACTLCFDANASVVLKVSKK